MEARARRLRPGARALLDSYDSERTAAADENIRHSTRSSDFITPKSDVSRTFRDAVLMLAKRYPFARRLVNSGRLSIPATLAASPLKTPDSAPFAAPHDARFPGGGRAGDRRSVGSWLLEYLGSGFTVLVFVDRAPAPGVLRDLAALAADPIACGAVLVGVGDAGRAAGIRAVATGSEELAQRYDARPGTTYLFRPDQHVCARWRAFDLVQTRAAIARASGQYVH